MEDRGFSSSKGAKVEVQREEKTGTHQSGMSPS
jgi:hypothetical protein